MCLKEVLGMDDRPVVLIGIPVVAFLVPLLFFNADLNDGLSTYLPKALVSFIYTLIYWITVRYVIIFFRRRFPDYRQTMKRISLNVLVIAPLYLVINRVMDFSKIHITLQVPEPESVSEFDYNVASIMLIILVATIYESVWLYDKWKASIVAQEKLQKEYVQSQLEGLRSQVNPHFLFNSLNTLSYLIPESTDRAVNFVQQLSKVYRYILEIKDEKLIPLEEELLFLAAYQFLLKERFGENLKITLEIPTATRQELLIPLSLQLLIENAIKHNIISSQKPLEIKLWVDKDRLLVRNNLQLKTQEMPSTKVGLQNIQNRYAFYTQEEVEVIETSAYFLVALPLLKKPVLV